MAWLGLIVGSTGIWFGLPWWLSALLCLVVAWPELTSVASWIAAFSIAIVGLGLWLEAPWWVTVGTIAVGSGWAFAAALSNARYLAKQPAL